MEMQINQGVGLKSREDPQLAQPQPLPLNVGKVTNIVSRGR